MANVVGDIAIQVGADIGPLVTGLDRGAAKVSAFGKTAEASAGGGMKRWTLAATAMGAAAAAAGLGVAALIKRSIDQAGALNDASTATGIHVAQLQAMTQVAEEAGSSQEELIASIKKMQNNIQGLLEGTKAQTDAFAKMGLAASDLAGLSPDQQFAKIAAAISALPEPTERTAAAMDAFGKAGADLLPMMQGYSDAVAEAAHHQDEFGVALSQADAKKLDDIGDAAGRLGDAAIGMGNKLALAFAPAILTAIEFMSISMQGLAEAFGKIHDILETTKLEKQTQDFAAAMEFAGKSANTAADDVYELANQLEGIKDPSVVDALRQKAEKMEQLGASFRAGTMGAEEYQKRIDQLIAEVNNLIASLGDIDGVDLQGIRDELAGLAREIAGALGASNALNASLRAQTVQTPPLRGPAGGFITEPMAGGIGTSPRPPLKPIDFGGGGSGGGGGGGGGSNPTSDALAALEERLRTQAEIEQKAYEDSQKTLEDALAQKLLTQEQYQADLEQLQKDHQDRMSAIDAGSYGDSLQKTGAYFGVLADTFASGNERMQKMGRAFGAAEALVNAWRAYTQTLADPSLPFFAKFAAAASVLSAGLSAVNAIKGGGGGGGSSGSAAAASPGIPAAPQSIANITLVGDTFSRDSIESLFAQINDGLRQGRIINLVQA